MKELGKKICSKKGGNMEKQLFFALVFTILLVSCQREQDWDGAPDINAKVESEQKTRTSLSVDASGAGTIYWNPSDWIDVFFGTKKAQYKSQNAYDAIAATFKTSDFVSGSDVSSTNIWGLYPSNSSSSCNGSSITTTLPSTQYGVPDTFDKDIFPAVAHSSSTTLQFYNVCGGIKFNLAYDDIKKITFRGNNNEDLAGTVSISFVDNLPKATIVNGVKEITLTPKTGTTFTKGKDYYFILLPGTLSAGFTITFTTTDGTIGILNYIENPVTIKRSIFGKKGDVDLYAAFADERQPNNVIYYTSTDGSIVTPFKTDVFGANIVSNEYVGGRGIITFNGEIRSIGAWAFRFCSKMTSIKIPSSVERIGSYAFGACSGLNAIDIPESVTSIDSEAFRSCSGLTSIEIPSSVTSLGSNPFAGCSGLETIVVQAGNSKYDSRNNCNAIIEKNTNTLVSGCKNTQIPSSVTMIGPHAFQSCDGLVTFKIPYWITSIGDGAFLSCSHLESVEIPNSVRSIGYAAFSDCRSLASFEIPSSVESVGSEVLYGCSGLSSIVSHSTNPLSCPSNGFDDTNDCPIYVPVGFADTYRSSWTKYASRIQENPRSQNVIYYTLFGDFWYEETLSETDIDVNAFGANLLYIDEQRIVFDGDVTEIGDYAFSDCKKLRSIIIPKSVISIGDYAFIGCKNLVNYVLRNPVPPSITQSSFTIGDYWPGFSFHIFVPEDSVSAYRTAVNWSSYDFRIYAELPFMSTGFYITAINQVIHLKDHVAYVAPLFGGLEITDYRSYVYRNGAWTVGDGYSIPLGVSAKDFYGIEYQYAYDSYSFPLMIRDLVSFEYGDNPRYVIDYSLTDRTITETFTIPISVEFSSVFGRHSAQYNLIIAGEAQ